MSTLQEIENFWNKVCFDPDFHPEGRFQTYRNLVTDRFFKVIQNLSRVASDILKQEEWNDLVWDFLKHSPPQSEILKELPFEFSHYLKNFPYPHQEKYPYLSELILYEYLEVQVRYALDDDGSVLPGKLRLNPAHALNRYLWPVHFIDKKNHDPDKLPKGEYHLLIWRDPGDLEVRFMEVNALVSTLVRILECGDRDRDSLLLSVARDNGMVASQDFMAQGKGLVDDLSSKGILLRQGPALNSN